MQSVFEASWAGAAAKVAYDVEFLTKDYSKILGSSNEELSKFAKEGNEAIFVDVFPKLRDLYLGPAFQGVDALRWDMKTLAEEQYLVQPLYDNLPPKSKELLKKVVSGEHWTNKIGASIFTKAKAFPPELGLFSVRGRWDYGLFNANFNYSIFNMPEVSDYYKNGGSSPKSGSGGGKLDTPLEPAGK